jgi:hypothetical protein
MDEATQPEDGREAGGESGRQAGPGADGVIVVAVTVTRTGGFAGLRRTWHAQPDRSEAPQWIALIDGCPWDAAAPTRPIPPTGADRFMWHVDAQCGDAERQAALADPEVRGPWRELIDAVRSASPKAPERPPSSPR